MNWKKRLISILKTATNISGSSKTIAGIPTIKSSHYNRVEEIIISNLLPEINKLPDIVVSIDKGPYNEYAGELLSIDTKSATLTKLKDDELREASVVAIPGLGGGDEAQRALYSLKQFRKVFPETVLYSSKSEGEERESRYVECAKYYSNQNFIFESESDNFFRKVISPRITSDKGALIPPQDIKRMILLNFSIGCREARSHMNFFTKYLLKQGIEGDNIQKYLDQISVINIGSPVNWDYYPPAFSPSTMNVISATDMGSKKPDEMFRAIFLNPKVHGSPELLFSRPFDKKGREFILTFGNGVVSNGKIDEDGSFRSNPLGHNLESYISALMNNPLSKEFIELQTKFIQDELTPAEFQEKMKSKQSSPEKYKDDEDLTLQAVNILMDSWSAYLAQEQWAQDKRSILEVVKSSVKALVFKKLDGEGVCTTEDPTKRITNYER